MCVVLVLVRLTFMSLCLMPVKLNTDDMKSDLVKTDNQEKKPTITSGYDNEIVLKKSCTRIIYTCYFSLSLLMQMETGVEAWT